MTCTVGLGGPTFAAQACKNLQEPARWRVGPNGPLSTTRLAMASLIGDLWSPASS